MHKLFMQVHSKNIVNALKSSLSLSATDEIRRHLFDSSSKDKCIDDEEYLDACIKFDADAYLNLLGNHGMSVGNEVLPPNTLAAINSKQVTADETFMQYLLAYY